MQKRIVCGGVQPEIRAGLVLGVGRCTALKFSKDEFCPRKEFFCHFERFAENGASVWPDYVAVNVRNAIICGICPDCQSHKVVLAFPVGKATKSLVFRCVFPD